MHIMSWFCIFAQLILTANPEAGDSPILQMWKLNDRSGYIQVTRSIKVQSQDSNLGSLARGSTLLNNTIVSVHLLQKLFQTFLKLSS